MSRKIPSRQEALALLQEFTKSENLRRHGLAVEAAMRAYARRLGEDEELWGVVGLLHDFDYESHPAMEEHPWAGVEILKERGWDDPELIHGILAHAPHTGTARESLLDKAIFACDEITGFITAVALVRPSKKLEDVKVKSIKKKMKDKAFAAAVSRDDIRKGAEELGVELDEHLQVVLEAMKGIAGDLGL